MIFNHDIVDDSDNCMSENWEVHFHTTKREAKDKKRARDTNETLN